MRNADNENEPFPFQSLAKITARLLTASKNENREDDGAAQGSDQERASEQREYVAQRLRDLAAFERRARGDKKPL